MRRIRDEAFMVTVRVTGMSNAVERLIAEMIDAVLKLEGAS